MQSRALVIKTYGDPVIGNAIADGITHSTALTVVNDDYARLQADYRRLQADYDRLWTSYKALEARDTMRHNADERRWEETRQELAEKYSPQPHGRIYNDLLLVWAILYLLVFSLFDRLWEEIEKSGYTTEDVSPAKRQTERRYSGYVQRR